MKLLVRKPSEANFSSASVSTDPRLGKQFSYRPGANNATYSGLVKTKKVNRFAQAAGKVGSFLGRNKLKAGLAGVGLVGAGILASKALSKPESLQSKLKKTLKKNPQLSQAASIASKMFR